MSQNSLFKTRRSGSKGVRAEMAWISGTRQVVSKEWGPVQRLRSDTTGWLIDWLDWVSVLSIFHMSGSGLDARDPQWRISYTPGTSSLRWWAHSSEDEFGLKVLLSSTGDSSQCFMAAWMGGEFGGEWIPVYVWLSSFESLSKHC